jgi:hypothetical protein
MQEGKQGRNVNKDVTGCDGESVMLMDGEYGDKKKRKRREKIFWAPKKAPMSTHWTPKKV